MYIRCVHKLVLNNYIEKERKSIRSTKECMSICHLCQRCGTTQTIIPNKLISAQ
jgi:hypothetical protein